MIKTIKAFKEFLSENEGKEVIFESNNFYVGMINFEGKTFHIYCPCKQVRLIKKVSNYGMTSQITKVIPNECESMDEFFQKTISHLEENISFREGVSSERKTEIIEGILSRLRLLKVSFALNYKSPIQLVFPTKKYYTFEEDAVCVGSHLKIYTNLDEVNKYDK